MLFNSYPFLLAFLPGSLIAYHLLASRGESARIAVLLAVSLIFYAAWSVGFLLLLAGSILVNFIVGRTIETAVAAERTAAAGRLLGVGVAFNLLLLGYFKYAHFLVGNVNAVAGTHFVLERIILPLGISFFSFEQIGYLVDLKRGHRYRADLLRYAVFVSFFPRLVAGPILRFSEIGPQLGSALPDRDASQNLAVGLTLFAIGLVKKSVLADGIAPYVAPPFATAAAGVPVDLLTAWGGALCYTCQLYFDFSGYSDMAIGAARCFGIGFPANFNSPYKSASIVAFWQRWHMTLSRFLRDYLYIPLGGNRHGPVRRYRNLMLTMLLGGLWHGAAWTFMAWGGLHGLYLVADHAWTALTGPTRRSRLAKGAGFAMTFIAVVVGWVFFRANSFAAAATMLAGMAGANGISLPYGLMAALGRAGPVLTGLGVTVNDLSGTRLIGSWIWIVVLLAIAWLLPNSQELLGRYRPVLTAPASVRGAVWSLHPGWAIVAGALAFLGLISVTHVSEFLYWQF